MYDNKNYGPIITTPQEQFISPNPNFPAAMPSDSDMSVRGTYITTYRY